MSLKMYKITITPRYRPRIREAVWSGEFETLPTKELVQRAVLDSQTNVEITEENRFLLEDVYPKCFRILQSAERMPTPIKGKVRILTIIQDEKSIGSIAIKEEE